MTLVKICGIRTVEEGRTALAAGADWLGFVLWPRSKRAVTVEQAGAIIAELRGESRDWAAVGVFVDPSADDVREAARGAGLDYAQLSGTEPAAVVRKMPIATIKTLHVKQGREHHVPEIVEHNEYGVDLYLLDADVTGQYGGTGSTFNWNVLHTVGRHVLVAGGLTPTNVQDAVRSMAPHGVDVSSGVEFAGGGKDPDLVRQFIEAVRTYDARIAHAR